MVSCMIILYVMVPMDLRHPSDQFLQEKCLGNSQRLFDHISLDD